ncbi:MAG: tRNA (guanosine(37)-N1)-methyltransferase TrmD [Patescibacteria group bacterium]
MKSQTLFNRVKFHILTIFPEMFSSYLNESILKRAQEKKLVKFNIVNIRNFTLDKHRRTDYKPYGGGPGLVFFAEPILRAMESIQKKILKAKSQKPKAKVVILAPGGKQFTNTAAINWAKKYTDIILVCGRYEGIDARVKKILKVEEISVGPYVLTGGELPALVIVDSVSRQIKGVLGNEDSPEEKRISSHEVYTRPEVLACKGKKYRVPKVLLSGNHAEIDKWKAKSSRK